MHFTSCSDDATNFGDCTIKSALEVTGVTTKSGNELEFSVLREIDTTYVRFYTKKDTLKDENGDYILDDKGKYQIKDDTIYYKGNITARFVEIAHMTLESPADTILISVGSNSKWNAPMPSAGGKAQWFFTQRLAGGGDGTVVATVTRNRNSKRPVDAVQYILTPDSTVMYQLTFSQKGERDK